MDENILTMKIIEKYKEVALRMLRYSFPSLSFKEINEALDYSIIKRMKNPEAVLNNNYSNKVINTTLLDMTEYILEKSPILTSYGVLFKKHSTLPNPIAKMLESFMDGRDIHKKEMFKYPKGSEQFEKYNLLQQLDKVDSNAYYGACGMYSCLYYNLHVAASVTTQGRSLISSAGILFEMFLTNSVEFGSLNEVVTFIDNVVTEKRTYDDKVILDEDITLEESFFKVMSSCGFYWIPTEEDLVVVWEIMMRLKQEDLNRLFYKNNLYSFMDNKVMSNAIVQLLTMMDKPYLDPNHVPSEIKVEIEEFWQLLKEYVYYSYQIIDRVDRLENMIRSTTMVIDTDSNLISLDAWYRYTLDKVYDKPMRIKAEVNPTDFVTGDEYANNESIEVKSIEQVKDFNFYTDEVVMMDRELSTNTVIAQDSLRYSIINILAYCLSEMINDYMFKYTQNSNSAADDRKCLIIMKNEFLFSRVLLTDAKKNYASIQELQEGNVVGKVLDVKGLASLTKSSMNEATRKRLREIMYEDILNVQNIDQLQVLKHLAILEKEIYESLLSGAKSYYKPVTIKSMNTYENPMRIQGIKAALVYNELRDAHDEAIDFTKRNGLDILKLNITPKSIEKIKDTYPEKYEKIISLMNNNFSTGIDAIAIPLNVETPRWLLEFIDYVTIINNNISGFPIESIGLHFAGGNVNYTNILSI